MQILSTLLEKNHVSVCALKRFKIKFERAVENFNVKNPNRAGPSIRAANPLSAVSGEPSSPLDPYLGAIDRP